MPTVDIAAIAEHSTTQQNRTNREKVGDATVSFKGNLRQAAAEELYTNHRNDDSPRTNDQRPIVHKKMLTLDSDFRNEFNPQVDATTENSIAFIGIKNAGSTVLVQHEAVAAQGVQQHRQSRSEPPEQTDESSGKSAQSPIDSLNLAAPQILLLPGEEDPEKMMKRPAPEKGSPSLPVVNLQDLQSPAVQQDKIDVPVKRAPSVPNLIERPESSVVDSVDVDFRLLEAQFQKFHSFLDRQKIEVPDSFSPAATELGALHSNPAVHAPVDKLSLKLSTSSDSYITCDIRRSDGSLDITVEAGGHEFDQMRGRENELKRSLGAIGIVVEDVKLQMTRQVDRVDPGDTAIGSEGTSHTGDHGAGNAKHNERNADNSMAAKQRGKNGASTKIDASVPHRSNGIYI